MTPPLILVAEVHPELRASVVQSLQDSGFRAHIIEDVPAMWRAMETLSPRALVLDTALRGPGGMDLCQEVRQRSNLPVILVGANSSEVDRIVGLELGADDYLSKPYAPRELVARLRAVLRRGTHGGPDDAVGAPRRQQARFDGWTVDFTRHEVRDSAGAPVELTGAEFALLTAMMEQAQRVIARERLVDVSNGRSAQSSDRSIDVLVSRLRRKLTQPGRVAPIVTVRGVGYMFSAAVEYR
ncbi:response regulator transcription factor [Sphingobium sp. AN641]|uniref:response regulator transcription factor n=1 Tax=Sphingobium sp. AN641 TaxID=3133443 RepID=UPI0030BC41AB